MLTPREELTLRNKARSPNTVLENCLGCPGGIQKAGLLHIQFRACYSFVSVLLFFHAGQKFGYSVPLALSRLAESSLYSEPLEKLLPNISSKPR